jgi:sugar-specific transcriptional regulator TrmB
MNARIATMDDAYKAFRADKKRPTTRTAATKADARAVHDAMVDELARARAVLETYRGMMSRITATPSNTKAATRALKYLKEYKDALILAEKRWRPQTPATRSVYPISTTGTAMMSAIHDVFGAIANRYERKTKNAAMMIQTVNRPTRVNTRNRSANVATMYRMVSDAWNGYTRARRSKNTPSPIKRNTVRSLSNELSILKTNMVLFKSIRDRVRARTANSKMATLSTRVKQVIAWYAQYIDHHERALQNAKRGRDIPGALYGAAAMTFSRTVVRFMNYASAKLGATLSFAFEKRQRPLTNGDVLNRYGVTVNSVANMMNRLESLEQRTLAMNRNISNKNVTLRQARTMLNQRERDLQMLVDELERVTEAWQECERQRRNINAFGTSVPSMA